MSASLFKVGDRVKRIKVESSNSSVIRLGHFYTVETVTVGFQSKAVMTLKEDNGCANWYADGDSHFELYNSSLLSKGKAMLNDLKNEALSMVKEHKAILTLLAALFLVDHFIFKGAFRERFKTLVENLIKKIEDKVKVS